MPSLKNGGKQATKSPKKSGPAPVGQDRIAAADLIQPITDRIVNGETYRQIAGSIGVSPARLAFWMDADPERSQACARAREMAGQTFDEMAEQRLDEAGDPFELAKAKELATHYRWRAKAVNPKRYGDRTTLAGDEKSPLTVVIQRLTPG